MTPRDANALAGLRAARGILWDGNDWDEWPISQICIAIRCAWRGGLITREEWNDAWALLGSALETKTSKSLLDWIRENGGAEWLKTATDRDKQQVRHLWLEQLISDLEARG